MGRSACRSSRHTRLHFAMRLAVPVFWMSLGGGADAATVGVVGIQRDLGVI